MPGEKAKYLATYQVDRFASDSIASDFESNFVNPTSTTFLFLDETFWVFPRMTPVVTPPNSLWVSAKALDSFDETGLFSLPWLNPIQSGNEEIGSNRIDRTEKHRKVYKGERIVRARFRVEAIEEEHKDSLGEWAHDVPFDQPKCPCQVRNKYSQWDKFVQSLYKLKRIHVINFGSSKTLEDTQQSLDLTTCNDHWRAPHDECLPQSRKSRNIAPLLP